jgi:hypothetical protein
MRTTTERIYQKLKNLTRKVRDDFRRKGIVLPAKKDDGSIKVGQYLIQRKDNDFYAVISVDGEVMADQINLPQTAAVVANHLALKNCLDKDILDKDREYGYSYFEYQLYQRAKERSLTDLDYFDVKVSKFEDSREQADFYKQQILARFDKLKKLA